MDEANSPVTKCAQCVCNDSLPWLISFSLGLQLTLLTSYDQFFIPVAPINLCRASSFRGRCARLRFQKGSGGCSTFQSSPLLRESPQRAFAPCFCHAYFLCLFVLFSRGAAC